LSIGACEGCGEFFAGEVHQIREGFCPGCGAPLRPASSAEAREYIQRWKEQERPSPNGGGLLNEGDGRR
jgi:hypothetical protein